MPMSTLTRDSMAVTSSNAGGSKIDLFLERPPIRVPAPSGPWKPVPAAIWDLM